MKVTIILPEGIGGEHPNGCVRKNTQVGKRAGVIFASGARNWRHATRRPAQIIRLVPFQLVVPNTW